MQPVKIYKQPSDTHIPLFIRTCQKTVNIVDAYLGSAEAEADAFYMGEALREARKAQKKEEVPVGAIIVGDSQVIGRAFNQVEMLKDATAHAEMLALTQAQSAVDDWRLNHCTLYVTKEPCPMCAGALLHARIGRVVFGLGDPKAGAMGGAFDLQSIKGLNHRCPVTAGVRAEESREILQDFFRARRKDK